MSSQFLFSRSFAHSIRLKIKHKLVDTASHLKQINRLFLPFSHIIVLTMRTSKKEKRDRKIEKTGLKDRVDIGELDASIHNSILRVQGSPSGRLSIRRIPFRSHRRRTSDFPIDTPTTSLGNLVYNELRRGCGGGCRVCGTVYS